MSTYRAIVRVEDGMLHTSRPLTAPDPVREMIDSLEYAARDAGSSGDLTVDLTVETPGESGTPIGDSVSGTSSTPLAAPDEDDDDLPAPLTVTP